MEYKVWVYILIGIIFVVILSLYLIMKLSFRKHVNEPVLTNEKRETPKYPSFTGVNLRENFRVNLDDVKCFIEFLDVDNEELNPKFFNAYLKNISLGGVKFVCEHEYPITDDLMIKVRFSLKNSMFILKGRIIRKELYTDRDRFGYGVQFTSLFDEDRELLYQILNRVMVDNRRKLKSNGLIGEESMV